MRLVRHGDLELPDSTDPNTVFSAARFFASASFRFSSSDSRRSSPFAGSDSVAFSTLRTASSFSSRSGTPAICVELQLLQKEGRCEGERR